MSQVDFQEDRIEYNRDFSNKQSKSGYITKLFIRLGLAKDEKGANLAMFVVALIFIAFSVCFSYFFVFDGTINIQTKSKEELIQNQIDKIPKNLPQKARERRIQMINSQFK
jgi:hypothetical protein